MVNSLSQKQDIKESKREEAATQAANLLETWVISKEGSADFDAPRALRATQLDHKYEMMTRHKISPK